MSRYEGVLEAANMSYKNRLALVRRHQMESRADDANMERELKKAKKALASVLRIVVVAHKDSDGNKEDLLEDILDPLRVASTKLQNMLNTQF